MAPETARRTIASPSPNGATASPSGSGAGATVGVLSLAVFMSSLDLFIVNLAFPTITRSFRGTDLGSLSWVLNAYTIVFAAVLVPAGRLADRIGRRRVLVAGLVVFAVGSAAGGFGGQGRVSFRASGPARAHRPRVGPESGLTLTGLSR